MSADLPDLSKARTGFFPLGFSLSAIMSILATPAVAQILPFDGDAIVVGDPMPGVCMKRTVSVSGEAGDVAIVAAIPDVAAMGSKGFVVSACPATFASRAMIERWRDEVCGMASVQDAGVQENFEALWGERAALLCGSIERVLGASSGILPTDLEGGQ